MTAYVIRNDGTSKMMKRLYCNNEDEELQAVLENNLDLLPGDQINPDDPRRWLYIAREMPVPDPSTGDNRWSIDFMLADQSAIPTFVEVKRYKDTRSRREVIGQMLEYAANGHYYWEKSELREFAEKSAEKQGATLEEALDALQPDDGVGEDAFFEKLSGNLREGQLRLIFFLEDSPMELRSVVDFMNKQMELSEVLLVEAKYYEQDGLRIIVPSLFGYTEEARRVKRIKAVTTQARGKWNKQSILEHASSSLGPDGVEIFDKIFDLCDRLNLNITYGTGKISGSIGLRQPDVCKNSFISFYTDGWVTIRIAYIYGGDAADKFKEKIIRLFRDELKIGEADKYGSMKHYSLEYGEWRPHLPKILRFLDNSLSQT